MVMKAMRQGAAGGVMKFVIFGFLIMAVGGMVFMDIGGFFRSGGVGSSDVAKVGGEKYPCLLSTVRFAARSASSASARRMPTRQAMSTSSWLPK